jgi:hypothetical protein
MKFLSEVFNPILTFLLAVTALVFGVLAFVFLLSLLWHGIPWVWSL